MSLSVALQYAVSGLNASQAQLQVVSSNIANAQTPGYSEETLPQTSTPVSTGGSGVVTGEVQRLTSRILQATLRNQTTTSSAAATTDNYQQQVQTLLGQIGSGNSLGDSLNSFASALQAAATTPQDPLAQAQAVNAGQQLTQQLNNLSSGVQDLRQSADSQIATDVGTLNTALASIATLNGQIGQMQALGESTAAQEDQRDQALTQVAQFIGVQSYTRPDGTMVVLSAGGKTLVDGSTARPFAYTQSGTVTASTALSPLTVGGIDVTSETTGGEIGALLQMRDTTLPGLTAQLNQFTNNLFNLTTTANLNTTNSGLGATNDAHHFFAAVDTGAGIDNAATIQVNPDLVASPSLLGTDAGGAADPTITQAISQAVQNITNFTAAGSIGATTTTLSNYVGQVIGSAATAASAATSNSTDQSALLSQMQGQYSSAVGVNLDQELSTLITYQNAYSASARVITTIQSMFQSLMNA